MKQGDSFNVEEHRLKNDSSTEWKLRRRFLLAFHDQFPLDRLLSLACCYINSECYGNRYPGPVMQQLTELKKDLPRDDSIADISHRAKTKVAFVKAEDQGDAPSRNQDDGQQSMIDAPVMKSPETTPSIGDQIVKASSSDDAPPDAEPKLSLPTPLNFVKSTDCYQSTDLAWNEPLDMQPAGSSYMYQTDGDINTHKELVGSLESELLESFESDKQIETSNISNQLMKKMGWSGGGLGRKGTEGIEVPHNIIKHERLGLYSKTGIQDEYISRMTVLKKSSTNNPPKGIKFVKASSNGDDARSKAKPPKLSPQNVEEELKKFYLVAAFLREMFPCERTNMEKLHYAVHKAQMKISDSIVRIKGSGFQCELKVNSVLVGTGEGTNKKTAKRISYENALLVFSNPYLMVVRYKSYASLKSLTKPFPDQPTFDIDSLLSQYIPPNNRKSKQKSKGPSKRMNVHIQTKQKADIDGDIFRREELHGSLESDEQIGTSNIGNQKGIEVPIETGNVMNCGGLGLHSEMGIKSDFFTKMRNMKTSSKTDRSMGIQFVKACSNSDDAPSAAKPPKLSPPKPLNFVKPTDCYQISDLVQCEPSDVQSVASSYQRSDLVQNETVDMQPTASNFYNLLEDEELQKFYHLAAFLCETFRCPRNPIAKLNNAVDKAKMKHSHSILSNKDSGFHCELKVNSVLVGSGEGTSKKTAKCNSYENALLAFNDPYIKIVRDNPKQPYLKFSPTPFPDQVRLNIDPLYIPPNKRKIKVESKQKNKLKKQLEREGPTKYTPNISAHGKFNPPQPMSGWLKDLSDFLIIGPVERPKGIKATTIISSSADWNHVPFESTLTNVGDEVMCTMTLGGIVIARNKAPGDLPHTLKTDTAEDALKYMRSVCWTIQTKKTADTDGDIITPEGLFESPKSDLQIGNSNIGNQLLKKMGWSGGGLGKKGNEGIEVPIGASNVMNREGLGLRSEMGIKPDFFLMMMNTLQRYIQSDKQTDLIVSHHFDKKEKKLFRIEAKKLGLKAHNHGTGEGRCVVVSRKRSARELFDHVKSCGGETSIYILLPPGSVTKPIRDLSDFLIIEPVEKPEGMQAETIISNSAATNEVQFESTLSNVGDEAMCTMTLGGFVIAHNMAPENLPSKLKN